MGEKLESYTDNNFNEVFDEDIVILNGVDYYVRYISHHYINMVSVNSGSWLHWQFKDGVPELKGKRMFTGKFKVGDVVKRKDGNRFSDTNSPTEVVTSVCSPYYKVSGQGGEFTEKFLEFTTPSPVKETTVVKKEIVPGKYGKVVVGPTSDTHRVDMTFSQTLLKHQLAEAIKTLQLIHDAMED